MISRVFNTHFVEKYVPNKIVTSLKNFRFELQFPERYKGTLIEKWANYWKNLYIDYKEVAVEAVENAYKKPVRAAFICTGMCCLAFCAHKNPDERCFRDRFLYHSNEMALIGSPIRNPAAVEHLKFLEKCYNAGIVRILSLGIVSFVWLNDYDKASGLYQAHCNYLEPKILTFSERIVDVGFVGHWFVLERKMEDFDINPSEFE